MAIELTERFLARGYSPKWNVQDILTLKMKSTHYKPAVLLIRPIKQKFFSFSGLTQAEIIQN